MKAIVFSGGDGGGGGGGHSKSCPCPSVQTLKKGAERTETKTTPCMNRI